MRTLALTLITALCLASCTTSKPTKHKGYEVYLKNGRDMGIITCDSVQMQSASEATIWTKGRMMKVYAESILLSN
jgi:hypothetical protein